MTKEDARKAIEAYLDKNEIEHADKFKPKYIDKFFKNGRWNYIYEETKKKVKKAVTKAKNAIMNKGSGNMTENEKSVRKSSNTARDEIKSKNAYLDRIANSTKNPNKAQESKQATRDHIDDMRKSTAKYIPSESRVRDIDERDTKGRTTTFYDSKKHAEYLKGQFTDYLENASDDLSETKLRSILSTSVMNTYQHNPDLIEKYKELSKDLELRDVQRTDNETDSDDTKSVGRSKLDDIEKRDSNNKDQKENVNSSRMSEIDKKDTENKREKLRSDSQEALGDLKFLTYLTLIDDGIFGEKERKYIKFDVETNNITIDPKYYEELYKADPFFEKKNTKNNPLILKSAEMAKKSEDILNKAITGMIYDMAHPEAKAKTGYQINGTASNKERKEDNNGGSLLIDKEYEKEYDKRFGASASHSDIQIRRTMSDYLEHKQRYSHKYVERIPLNNGKYRYIYPEDISKAKKTPGQTKLEDIEKRDSKVHKLYAEPKERNEEDDSEDISNETSESPQANQDSSPIDWDKEILKYDRHIKRGTEIGSAEELDQKRKELQEMRASIQSSIARIQSGVGVSEEDYEKVEKYRNEISSFANDAFSGTDLNEEQKRSKQAYLSEAERLKNLISQGRN